VRGGLRADALAGGGHPARQVRPVYHDVRAGRELNCWFGELGRGDQDAAAARMLVRQRADELADDGHRHGCELALALNRHRAPTGVGGDDVRATVTGAAHDAHMRAPIDPEQPGHVLLELRAGHDIRCFQERSLIQFLAAPLFRGYPPLRPGVEHNPEHRSGQHGDQQQDQRMSCHPGKHEENSTCRHQHSPEG
jgi:hypothetical protein